MYIKALTSKMEENGVILTGDERVMTDGEAIKHLNLMGTSEAESEEILLTIRTKTSIELLTDAQMEALIALEVPNE
jgi:hypothetical protein